ncbi:MAG: hypothetical protein M3256_21185 [Actinomycetota bacterium]|nr:hypothetical protein [Actinomycetota bacterium]
MASCPGPPSNGLPPSEPLPTEKDGAGEDANDPEAVAHDDEDDWDDPATDDNYVPL